MSSQPRIEIQGQAPFKQSGVYEAQISIIDVKPSDNDIRAKKFTPLWKGNFHLKVKDGIFSEILGDSKNPLPSSVDNLNTIWIVVNDLFSSVYSVFDVTLRKTSEITESQEKPEPRNLLNLNALQKIFPFLIIMPLEVLEVQLVTKVKLVQLVPLVTKVNLVLLVTKVTKVNWSNW